MLEKAPARSVAAKRATGKAQATKDPVEAAARKGAGRRTTASRAAVRKTAAGNAHGIDLQALIRQRAYELWERDGRPEGRDHAHWQQAEREVGAAHRIG